MEPNTLKSKLPTGRALMYILHPEAPMGLRLSRGLRPRLSEEGSLPRTGRHGAGNPLGRENSDHQGATGPGCSGPANCTTRSVSLRTAGTHIGGEFAKFRIDDSCEIRWHLQAALAYRRGE